MPCNGKSLTDSNNTESSSEQKTPDTNTSPAPNASPTPNTNTTGKPESSKSPSTLAVLSSGTATTANGAGALPRITQAHAERLRERGLNPVLCASLGVHSHGKAIAFDYLLNGKVHNTKIRYGKGNMPWAQRKPLIAYGVDSLQGEPHPDEALIITEGEFDAIACIQSGSTRVVSVPNGAQSGEGGFTWLYVSDALHPDINKFKHFVLFTDNDSAGLHCRDALAVRLGEERCSYVTLPEGCKDANDVLRLHGPQALQQVIHDARPLWRQTVATIDDIPEPREEEKFRIGFPELDSHGFRLTLPALWSFVGPYHVGKSVLLRQILAQLWKLHRWRSLLSAFEEKPKPRFVRDFRRHIIGRGFYQEPWTAEEIQGADAQLRDGFRFLQRPKRAELDPIYVLRAIEMSVKMDDCRVVVLDPMNEILVRPMQGQFRTDILADFLVALKELADDYRLLVIVCAHTTKTALTDKARYKQRPILTLQDAEESKAYGNKADIGWCVWRSWNGPTYVNIDKLKDHETMGKPTLVELEHHRGTNSFSVAKLGYDIL